MRTALLFPGQGCQSVGMGKHFYDQYAYVRTIFEEVSDALHADLTTLCFQGPADELNRTIYAQPAIFAVSLSAHRVLEQEIGLAPVLCCGHSMGEITALTAAGVIPITDALEIIQTRGHLMEECANERQGAMLAVIKGDLPLIRELCLQVSNDLGLYVNISNYNSPEQVVVSGDQAAIDALTLHLQGQKVNTIPLKVKAAFHSPLMNNAAAAFRESLRQYTFHAGKIPVLSSYTGALYDEHADIPDMLSQQIVYPVQWTLCMQFLRMQSDQAIDLSPNGVLKRFMSEDDVPTIHFYDADQLQEILTPTPASSTVMDQKTAITFLKKCIVATISVKNQNFDEQQYKTQVINQYMALEAMLKKAKSGVPFDQNDKQQGIEYVSTIFRGKKLPDVICKEWMDELLLF